MDYTYKQLAAALKRLAIKRYESFERPAAPAPVPVTKYTERAAVVARACEKHAGTWGCYYRGVVRLMEAVIESRLPKLSVLMDSANERGQPAGGDGSDPARMRYVGTLVIPEDNPNGHSYKLGEPVLVKSDGYALSPSWDWGNFLIYMAKGSAFTKVRLVKPGSPEFDGFFELLSGKTGKASVGWFGAYPGLDPELAAVMAEKDEPVAATA